MRTEEYEKPKMIILALPAGDVIATSTGNPIVTGPPSKPIELPPIPG